MHSMDWSRTPIGPVVGDPVTAGARILLADDNADMRQYVQRLLEPHYQVEAVTDGQAALEAVRRRLPDLVLTDVTMPRQDGFALLRRLRAEPETQGIPVILLSVRAGEESCVDGLEAGADDYLAKPFNARELLARVECHLTLARLRQGLRETEERYRGLVELSPEAIFIHRNARIEYVNPAALRLFGATVPEQIQGKSLFDFHPSDYHPIIHQRIQTQLRDGKPVPLIKEKIIRLDGTIVDVEVTASPFTDRNGPAIQVIVRDISKYKQAKEDLKHLNATLEQRVAERSAEAESRAAQLRALASEMTLTEQRERRRLAQVLHDDLQQMLVAAKMQVTIANRKVKDDGVARSLRQIDDLLDQSIAESRSLTVELSPPVLFDRGLVGGLEWLARRFLDKHHLPITLELDAEAEPADEGTRIFLFQAAREMLFNTVKHAQAQSARICLSRLDGDRLRLVVLDDGQGFDPSIMQIASTSGGFGLFSIRERLEVVGGRLEVISAPGRGTQMVIEVFGGRPVPPAESLPVPGKPPTR